MEIRLAVNSQSFLFLPSAEIKNVGHYNMQGVPSYNKVDHGQSFIWSDFFIRIFTILFFPYY